MFTSKFVWLSLASAIFMYFSWKFTSRTAYEAPDYQVLKNDGALELREYPVLVTASTDMKFQAQGNDGSFKRLFRYISGDNANQQKIAMTVPVFMEPKLDSDSSGKMAFVIPAETTRQGAVPAPSNQNVEVRQRPAGKYATYRFSGRMDRKVIQEAEAKLRKWIGEEGWEVVDDLEAAGYDPPWTPGLLRRNEVLLRVEIST